MLIITIMLENPLRSAWALIVTEEANYLVSASRPTAKTFMFVLQDAIMS